MSALVPLCAQDAAKPQPGTAAEDKRVLGVLPNYRTANGLAPFVPVTAKQKLAIATKDSFDYPVLLLTGFFAGISQATGTDGAIYGGGVKGFGYRYGINYADQVIGNYYPEAVIPILFHVDPRYFRKSTGTVKGRFAYAVSRIFVCKDDHGNLTFNSPEFLGNGLASVTALSYHVHERTAGDAAVQFGTYLLTDMGGQVMKEFWPDVKRKLHRRGRDQ